MSDPWHRPLAGLRDAFAARNDDLRHLLLTIDGDVYLIPGEWKVGDPRDGIAWWGLPPETEWRQLSGEPVARPVVDQRFEFGIGVPFCWKHTFYGFGGPAYQDFDRLAYRTAQCLVGSPPEVYEQLSRLLGLPADPPGPSIQGRGWLWWIRAVHGIGQRHHPDTDLRAERYVAEADPNPIRQDANYNEALRQGRPGVAEFSFSVLQGNLFECSAWAIDLILRSATAPKKIVRVRSCGSTRYMDVADASSWDLKPPRYSKSLHPNPLYWATQQQIPWLDRIAFRYIIRTVEGQYLLWGAFEDDWNRQLHEFHFWEILPQDALDLLISSGNADDLPNDLQNLLYGALSATQDVATNDRAAGSHPNEGSPIWSADTNSASVSPATSDPGASMPPEASQGGVQLLSSLDIEAFRPFRIDIRPGCAQTGGDSPPPSAVPNSTSVSTFKDPPPTITADRQSEAHGTDPAGLLTISGDEALIDDQQVEGQPLAGGSERVYEKPDSPYNTA
jgi:hypothetical protein